MRGLGRRTGWLGWAVAGVLLLSAGGVALAAQDTTSTTQAGVDKGDRAAAGFPGHGRRGLGHGLGRRVLHGEVTLQTREGVKTIVVARGEVTALSGQEITVKSSDEVSTAFKLDGDTRYGFRNEPAPTAELQVGDSAWVVGERSGDTVTARRVLSGELPQRGPADPGKGATP